MPNRQGTTLPLPEIWSVAALHRRGGSPISGGAESCQEASYRRQRLRHPLAIRDHLPSDLTDENLGLESRGFCSSLVFFGAGTSLSHVDYPAVLKTK